jgi:hypothetical protein
MPLNRPLSLSDLQTELAHWRRHRQPRHIPHAIREQAVRLLSEHKACEIKTALNINHRTLKRWKQECRERGWDRYDETSNTFITLPVLEPPPGASSALLNTPLKITRHGRDGSALSVEGSLSLEQWRCALGLLASEEVFG